MKNWTTLKCLKHFATVGTFNHLISWSCNLVSLEAISLGETQEATSDVRECSQKIFSPGVHKIFWPLKFHYFCACWVHIKYISVKMQILFEEGSMQCFLFYDIANLPQSQEEKPNFTFCVFSAHFLKQIPFEFLKIACWPWNLNFWPGISYWRFWLYER